MKSAKSKRCVWTLIIIVWVIFVTSMSTANATDEIIGLWHLDEITDDTTYDDSGNNNDGMVYGASLFTGVENNALSFDGTDDYVDCSNDSIYNFNDTNSFTISCWVKPDDLSNKQGIIGKWSGSWTISPYQIAVDDYGQIRVNIGGGGLTYGSVYIPANSLSTGNWYHIVATYDGSTLRCYLNSEEMDSEEFNLTLPSNTASLTIGVYGNATKNYFDGMIDEIKMYNYVLIQTEIDELYKPAGLCGNWDFNDSNADDKSIYDNDGTSYGSPSWGTGVEGKSIVLDGIDDYVDCGNDSMYNFNDTNSFTVSCWIKSDDFSNKQGIIGKWGGSWTMSPYQIVVDDYGQIRSAIGAGGLIYGDVFIPASSLSTGNWYHIATTYDDSDGTLRTYLDGKEVASKKLDLELTSNTSDLTIGMYGNSTKMYFDGDIDNVKVYNYSLASTEIHDLYLKAGLCGNWEMNNISTTEIDDSSKYNNDGIRYGTSWVSGHPDSDGYFRNALSFDGTDDYVDCGNDSIYNFNDSNAFTISFWMKPDDLSEMQSLVGKWGGSWVTSPYQIAIDNESQVRVNIGGGGTAYGSVYIPANSLSTGNWHHIVATYDGSTLRCYLNSKEMHSEEFNLTLPSNTASLTIGVHGNATKYYFDGVIDKVKIYSRALDQNAINSLYNNLLSAYANQTYYTTEDATIICSVNMPSTELDDCYLLAKNASDTTLDTNNSPETDKELTISNGSLSIGTNVITVELHKDAGELLYSYDVDVIKRTANSGFETKIDRKNGVVLRNGSAFFPVGIYMNRIESSDTYAFEDVGDAGFNTIVRWQSYGVSSTDATTYLENAAAEGLLVIDKLSAYSSVYLTSYKLDADVFWNEYIGERDDIIDAVAYAKLESNLLAYYTFDEPLPPQFAAGKDLYARTNAEDGYHPSTTMNGLLPNDENYNNWYDIITTITAWFPPVVTGDLRSSINYVTKMVHLSKIRARKDHKALWATLITQFNSHARKRSLTAEEQQCQTYLALIHGAKGIMYFRYPIYHDDMWSKLSDLAGEIDDLSPSLLNDDLEQTISYYDESTPVEFNPEADQFVDVQVCLFKAPSSASYDYVLLVANTLEYSVDVAYNISLLGASGTVSRLFDTATYTVSNGEFNDTLAGYDTRAYTFSSSSTDAITIAVDSDPGTPSSETNYSTSGRPNCTNLMQNPTLEDSIVTNWPDYCFPWYASPRINATGQQWGLETIQDSTDLPTGYGSKCLKIADGDNETLGEINGAYFYLTPQHTDTNGKDYTFSVYIKADTKEGRVVRIGCSLGYAEWTVNESWTRCDYTCSVPANWNVDNYFYVQLWDTGNIKIDAIQVEATSQYDEEDEGVPISFTTN